MSDSKIDALVAAATEDGVDLDGLQVESTGAGYRFETPQTFRTGLSETALREAADGAPTYVSNWYFWCHVAPDKPARYEFLRWLEADAGGGGGTEHSATAPERFNALADGHTREWGQLAVTVFVDFDDGCRYYDLRHVDDLDVAPPLHGNESDDASADDADPEPEALDVYSDPVDVRVLVKYDDRGRYRPLKTAPTLPNGWVFPDLAAAGLVRAVDFAYPATVENWHREREGELDVSNWRETVERQTGIYGVVKTWDRGRGHEHVNWVAEACCDDSQCLKRREWAYDDATDLDVDGGDTVFPCREPCSLVIAAARQWTKLEGEEPQTYEFELTPSEKEQVEAIVEAVADGRTDEVREAEFDDPVNRYRARYLRAKRFEDGDLGGVPTDGSDPGADGERDES